MVTEVKSREHLRTNFAFVRRARGISQALVWQYVAHFRLTLKVYSFSCWVYQAKLFNINFPNLWATLYVTVSRVINTAKRFMHLWFEKVQWL